MLENKENGKKVLIVWEVSLILIPSNVNFDSTVFLSDQAAL